MILQETYLSKALDGAEATGCLMTTASSVCCQTCSCLREYWGTQCRKLPAKKLRPCGLAAMLKELLSAKETGEKKRILEEE